MRMLTVQREDTVTLRELAELREYLSLGEVAQVAEVAEITVRRWIQAGHGPVGHKVGGRWRFPTKGVIAFLEGREA